MVCATARQAIEIPLECGYFFARRKQSVRKQPENQPETLFQTASSATLSNPSEKEPP
ncbi:hypothetical protein HMPREF9123_0291 [Neisseria bacilliformis ATCC BAA-1200]|uniref:Uncharacterized protein n=1 Tax=Neisseria bacilliformis ATCC BAA-1200 TaxID=888742 RepID=F2B946_9NEIS|nr:hypothetical protein HMPREF9123_0291 [Neisseria bacilliformis ATCC BAA-1200]